jgi:hypothetical protein
VKISFLANPKMLSCQSVPQRQADMKIWMLQKTFYLKKVAVYTTIQKHSKTKNIHQNDHFKELFEMTFTGGCKAFSGTFLDAKTFCQTNRLEGS